MGKRAPPTPNAVAQHARPLAATATDKVSGARLVKPVAIVTLARSVTFCRQVAVCHFFLTGKRAPPTPNAVA